MNEEGKKAKLTKIGLARNLMKYDDKTIENCNFALNMQLSLRKI